MSYQMVLVFESDVLKRLGLFQGYTFDVDKYLPHILNPANSHFMPREEAERDTRYKQLIPYVILRFQDTVFNYVRGKRSQETRLVEKRSIGLGGHIDIYDRNFFSSDLDLYLEAAKREVSEEVTVETAYEERIVALINDDSNNVGNVHFGIVHIWDLDEPIVQKREGLITKAKFTSIDNLKRATNKLETWSQIVLRVLEDPRMPKYEVAREEVDAHR